MTRIIKRTKALALLSIIVAATVFGAVIFSVSASEEEAKEENTTPCRGLPNFLLEDLTEEQLENIAGGFVSSTGAAVAGGVAAVAGAVGGGVAAGTAVADNVRRGR